MERHGLRKAAEGDEGEDSDATPSSSEDGSASAG